MEDEQVAAELAAMLLRAVDKAGPLAAVRRLTRILKILSIVTRVITFERNRQAHVMGAVWPQRRAAELVGVTGSTMQRWMEAGRGANSDSIGEFEDDE